MCKTEGCLQCLTSRQSCFVATWIGGGILMAVTEMVYDPEMGLIWALMPVQYSVSFVIGKSDSGGVQDNLSLWPES